VSVVVNVNEPSRPPFTFTFTFTFSFTTT